MAWTTQFYTEFYQGSNLCRVDIEEDNVAFNQLVNAGPSPIRILRPKKDIFDPVKGSGATMQFLSPSDKYFIGLMNASPKQYRLKFTFASTLSWFGYLNNSPYREPYDETTGYYVELTANNGFALLDRIKFLDGSGDPYEGVATQWDVIKVVLGHWGLMDLVTNVFVGISTTSSEVTIGSSETIFHNTYVNYGNYYDEDGEPMTSRQVLEAILRPYGAIITMIGSIILITDINSLADDISYKSYTNAFVYSATGTLPASFIVDINTAGYYRGGATLNGIASKNRQVVAYSPYANDSPEESIQNVEDMTFSSGTAPSFAGIGSGSSQRADNISGLAGWTFYNTPNTDRLVGSRNDSTSDAEYYIRIVNPNDGASPIDTTHINLSHSQVEWDLPYIIGIDKYYLKITGLIRALDDVDPYIDPTYAIYHVGLHARIYIGTKSFDPSTHAWNTSQNEFIIMGGNYDKNNMGEWQKFKTTQSCGGSILATSEYPMTDRDEFNHEGIYIGLPAGVYGKMKLNFSEFVSAWTVIPPNSGWDDWNDTQTALIKTCEVKDIKIELIRRPELTNANTDDIEYLAEFDDTWRDEAPKITLNHGTSGVAGTPFDRGGLIYDDSGDKEFFTEHTRAGDTDTIENLLLNSLQANYENSRVEISAEIVNTTGAGLLRYIDGSYLSGKVLFATKSEYDPALGYEAVDLEEVIEDSEVGTLSKTERKVPKRHRSGRVYWDTKE